MTAATDPVLRAFPPQFASFALGLHPPRADAVPLPDLLSPTGLDHLAATFGAFLGSVQRRAVLSRWAQHYLLVLVPPVVATALLTVRRPALDLGTAAVALSPVALPIAVCLPGAAGRTGQAPAERLAPLLGDHLVPMARRLAEGGLPEPVFWSNVAHVLAWALGIVQAPSEATALLADQLCLQPGLGPLMRSARQGRRGVCCLRFRLPGLDRCAECPVGCRAF